MLSFFSSLFVCVFVWSATPLLQAQDTGRIRLAKENLKPMNPKMKEFLNMGQMTGKIIDSSTQKGLAEASILVFAHEYDSVFQKKKYKLLQSVTTNANGEFELTNLPLLSDLQLRISNTSYKPFVQNVSYGLTLQSLQGALKDFTQIVALSTKDLGKIPLQFVPKEASQDKETLSEVVVSSAKRNGNFGVQVFSTDKTLVAAGATAQELLKTIPMVSVDVEGNVTIRNAAPQIYVDGKPSMLTLDQIPADLIDRVEVMTNPSAKYDAEGQGGILNIVLKKSQKLGINANVMLGSYVYMKPYKDDVSLYHYNAGLILNVRKNKVNTFLNLLHFQRRMNTLGATDRQYVGTGSSEEAPQTLHQQSFNLVESGVNILRGGIDYFLTNKNTLSLEAGYTAGTFTPTNELSQEALSTTNLLTKNLRKTESDNHFEEIRAMLSYKRTFEKQGKELTSNLFFNTRNLDFLSTYHNTYSLIDNVASSSLTQQTNKINSSLQRIRFQTDYTNPITENNKIEAGININYTNTPFTNLYSNISVTPATILSRTKYTYSDLTLSAYGTYSQSFGLWNVQGGLRIEQFYYDGALYNLSDQKTQYTFTLPIGVFPSLFVTYKASEVHSFQLSYSMRINRPSIFNLTPVIDYSDSTNLRQGNPDLSPETIHIGEINYQYTTKNNYVLLSLYGKYTRDLITQYQKTDLTSEPGKTLLINTFLNSDYGLNYGLEVVSKNTVWKGLLDFTTDVNIYNTALHGGTKDASIQGQLWSYNIKETAQIKLPLGFSFQSFIEYQHTALVPPSTGNRTSGNNQPGGPPGLAIPSTNAQGYIRPNFGVDIAIKKEFFKGMLSFTLTGADVFQTRKYNAYTSSPWFSQNTWTTRNQTYFYLSMNLRLGKMDVGLLKKKNIKAEKENMQNSANEAF